MLPENFKLLGLDIKVIYSERNKDHDYYSSYVERCEINVYTEHAPEKVKQMLFMSILSVGICSFMKLGISDKSLDSLSRMVWAVFRDNPVLIKGEIPEKIRVLGLEYSMIEKVHLEDLDSGGKIDYGDLLIQFPTNLNTKLKYVILWHEVIHEIIFLCDKESSNELNICGVSNLIGDLVFNNDMSWMGEGEE